ncbi:MAG: glutamine amidotransferase [Euryarchaeota archaeon]|nr:glutamine amidotransferase [Euryarchaeota archaeon]
MAKSEFDPYPYIEQLRETAEHGKSHPHPDGWGVWLKARNVVYHRETAPIWESHIPAFPRAKIMFAHARKKGKGAPVAIENVHPFVRRGAVFMHNGFVKVDAEGTDGETDSEKLFVNLLRDFDGTLRALENTELTSANFVMYRDGKLYVLRYALKSEDYYSIYLKKESDKIIIATEGDGELVPNRHLCIIDSELNVECRQVFPDTPR